MDVISNLSGSLDAELEKARETLRSVDDNIKKVFGKDASELTVFGRNRRGPLIDNPGKEDHYNNDHFQQAGGGGRRRRDDFERDRDEPNEKRRRGGGSGAGEAFSGIRLMPAELMMGIGPRFGGGRQRNSLDGGGGDEGFALPGRRLASRVVTSGKEKSRDEVLAEQRQDRSGRERNRRMFGALLGTLQRFKQDETKLKEKEDKRAVIEAKLDEAAKHEREVVKTKKHELIKERRINLTEIKRIEVKRRRIADLEQWEDKTKYLTNFIRTEAKPHIFYLPKIMNPIMECRLEQSKQCVTEMISQKRKLVIEDLEDYEQRSKRYWEGRMAGRTSNRKIDPMDADIEDELHDIMKNDDLDVTLEEEDLTITVYTNNNVVDGDTTSNAGGRGTNGVVVKRESVDGKENMVVETEMKEEVDEGKSSPNGGQDEDGEEIEEETTIEVKEEEVEAEKDTENDNAIVVRPQVDSVVDEDQEDQEEEVEQEEEDDDEEEEETGED